MWVLYLWIEMHYILPNEPQEHKTKRFRMVSKYMMLWRFECPEASPQKDMHLITHTAPSIRW